MHVIMVASEANQLPQLLRKAALAENEEDRVEWTRGIYSSWAEKDSDAAAEAIAQISDPAQIEPAMTGFLSGWSRNDPAAALDYAFAHHNDPPVKRIFNSIIYESIRSGEAEANATFVERITDAGLLDELGSTLSKALASSDPTAAFDIASKATDPEKRLQTQQHVLNVWAHNDFESARSVFTLQIPNENKAEMVPILASSLYLSANVGEQLTSLLDSIPAGPGRTKAIENLLERALPISGFATTDFMNSLKTAATSEPNLSKDGQALRSKLFGE